MKKERLMKWIPIVVFAIVCGGCSAANTPETPKTPPKPLTLATTTSTRDSGLLDVLVPMFENETGITLKVIAVGTGQALELGRRGDADVLLTHAPAAEKKFVSAGYGEQRRYVMYNDFVLVGSQSDPAQIKTLTSAVEAFRRIAAKKSPFVSRGDESGTHMKERAIWKQANINPQGDWYVGAGSGMAQTLRMASEKRAYTLTDRATFLAQKEHLDLEVLTEGDRVFRNLYAVIPVNAKKHPGVNRDGAQRFSNFLLAPATQQVISKFGIKRFGQPLFYTGPQKDESQK